MLKDLALVVVTLVACSWLFAALGAMLLSAPLAMAAALGVATWRLRVQGSGWRAVGLARPRSLLRAVGAGLLWLLAAYGGAFVVILAAMLLHWPAPDVSVLGIARDLPHYLLMLALAWTSAAFAEEMLFRGFMLPRIEAALGSTALAVLLQAVAFGALHAYQGPSGMLVTGTIGLVFGIGYARGRSLWPLILAHGLLDTVALTLMYLGVAPPR
jgi:membrane protease YdiL (CAAX protease family)